MPVRQLEFNVIFWWLLRRIVQTLLERVGEQNKVIFEVLQQGET
jgi:hypothetical protein